MSFPNGQQAQSSQSLDCVPQCRQLTFSEIQEATKNFDESLVIGHGGFGKVYRGTITNGESILDVAIKRLESTSDQGAEEFWAEVEMLSKLRHCNLVSLIGYCNDGKEMILVYEYMPKGTLAYRLHKCPYPLTWVRRLKISIGAARGLEYLHTGTGIRQGVVHRDVKSSNILLDGSWASKISDFGLSKIVPMNQPTTYVKTLVKGSFGYLDPNYFQTGKLTRKSDVYAFGVILFEILCGRKALDTSLDEEQMGLATWVQDSIKEGRLKQIIDSNLRGTISSKCMTEFAQLANQCLHSHPKNRPTMAEVVVGLESILVLQEKINKRLLPMGRKIFGIKVPAFGFPSSHETSVAGTSSKSMESYFYTVGGENYILRQFDFEIINVATRNFSSSNKISHDKVGPMHKGKLENGQDITIVGPYPQELYDCCMNQVSILVKIEHQNLAQLLGWCIEGTNVYLLYDTPQNYATLEYVLSDDNRAPLDWDARYKILLGVARTLLYLHKHAPIRVLYCDVKPGNILLDEGLDPKLHGFYYAVSAAINETDCIEMVMIRGTRGYLAPEYGKHGRLSTKTDVFDFGLLVLETITGRRICSFSSKSERTITDYTIWRNWVDGTYSNIIDTRISVDSRSIKRFIHLGLWCIQIEAADRPTMEEVVCIFLGNSSSYLPTLKDPKSLEPYLHKVGCGSPMFRRFDFETINVAVENFSASNKISHDILGPVHKGRLLNGQDITVVGPCPDERYDFFMNHVSILVKAEHKNLAQLLGWCIEGTNAYLLYDTPHIYSTLEHTLYDNNCTTLDWGERYKILLGVAQALLYLHKHAPIRVLYCDVKPGNILLDEGLDPKLHGFYHVVSGTNNETDCIELNVIRGTREYLAPEYEMHGRLSTKTDVFDFGLLVLETIAGRKICSSSSKSERMLTEYMIWRNWVNGTSSNIIDTRISVDSRSIKRFIDLGLWCIQTEAANRPTMEKVVSMFLGNSSSYLPILKDPKFLESYLYNVGGENQILRRFEFGTINVATENFSASSKISHGILGPMHKGKLQNGQDITVAGPYPHERYDFCMNHVSILVKIEHQNLAQLLGWCIEGTDVYFLYDTPHNYATLENALYAHNRPPLDWDARYKVLLGVARLLLYLHTYSQIRVLNCDVKAGNILLDEGLDPKLHGFYHAVYAAINEPDCIEMDRVYGTWGYMAPEYAMHGCLSTKSDVYDFGVLVLETIAGHGICSCLSEYQETYTENIWRNWVDERYSNIIDTRISVDPISIKRFIHIGLWCIQIEAVDRPTMEEVVDMFLGKSSSNLPILKDPNGWLKFDSDGYEGIDPDDDDSDIVSRFY